MGLNYSLAAIIPRARSNGMLSSLVTILTPESAARFGHLEWQPATESRRRTDIGTDDIDARGILGVTPESEDLSLLIQLEREMEQYVHDHGFECFDHSGSFGSLSTSVYAGAEFVLLEMIAVTSGISRVLWLSNAVHQQWRSFAEKANAIVAYVDMENDRLAKQVYPRSVEMLTPDVDTLSFAGDYRFSIDRFGCYVKSTNNL